MYGGLFGDLPATKKDGGGTSQDLKDGGDDKNATANTNNPPSGITAKPPQVNSFFAPTAARKKAKRAPEDVGNVSSETNKAQYHSILQSVGHAGTTMAFVPTAALKRKKPNPISKASLENPKSLPSSKRETTDDGDPLDIVNGVKTENATVLAARSTGSVPSTFAPHDMEVTTTIVRSSTKQDVSSDVIDIHGTHHHEGGNPSGTWERGVDPDMIYSETQKHENGYDYDDAPPMEEITDPYDPYFPNDLLQYWEMQAAAEERARLERETKEALEKQKLLREQLERERQELQERGEYGQLVTQSSSFAVSTDAESNAVNVGMGRGRGRGRGVSNLPAWLIQKHRNEASDLDGKGSESIW